MVPFGKQQQRKKLKRSRIWTVPCILILIVTTQSIFSMWLCCLLWIFYQAITGTGLAWVCLSAWTWRGAPLLDVDFPLLVFDLRFSLCLKFFSKFFFSLPPLIYIYTPMLLYHEMKRNKLRSIWDSTVRKNQVACPCVFVYNKSNAAILKMMFVELRHQTRSPVSLTDGEKIMPSTVFQLDGLVRKYF
mgnify:CR=1 FL=1